MIALAVSVLAAPATAVAAGQPCPVPDPPTGLAFHVDGNAVTLSWSLPGLDGQFPMFPGFAGGWIVEVGTAPGQTVVSLQTAEGSVTWTRLTPFPVGTFYLRVRTKDDCGASLPSEEVSVTTGAPHPAASMQVQEFGWNRSQQFIELRNAAPEAVDLGGWRLLASFGAETRTIAVIAPGVMLPAGCSYLLASGSPGPREPSDAMYTPAFFSGVGIALARPDGSIVDQVGLSPRTFPQSPYFEGRPISVGSSSDPGPPEASFERRFLIDTNNNEADFRFRSESEPRGLASCSGPSGPRTPESLRAVVSATGATLTWEPSPLGTLPTDHLVEVGSITGASDLGVFSTGSGLPSFMATGVPPGTFFVRVRARNPLGVSNRSNELVLTFCGPPCVPVPGRPRIERSSVAGSTVVLEWSAPLDGGAPTSYVLEAGSTLGAADLGTFDTGSLARAMTVPGVPPGVYFVRIRARNAKGVGLPSNEWLVLVEP